MDYTEEQKKIIDHVSNNDSGLVINAYAGTGKTSTLVGIVEANPDTEFLYLAFNRAIKNEAKNKFPENCRVYTLHGLAYQFFARDYFGPKLRSRLELKWKNKDYMEFFDVKSGVNRSNFICFAARSVVYRFKNSADEQILEKHIDPEHVLNLQNKDKEKVLNVAKEMWALESDPDGEIPITHDTYLKCFQLSKPDLDICDIILLDEAQDLNPVTNDIVKNFESIPILVGDSYQSIYKWRGAVNSIETHKDKYPTLWLTKSFRFGDSIASLATRILKMLQPGTPVLEGNLDVNSKITTINKDEQYTMLFRTNAELTRKALHLIDAGKEVYVEGGVTEFCNDMLDLYALSKKQKKSGKSNKYRIFKSFEEVKEESEHAIEIQYDLRLLNDLGDGLPAAIEKLRNSVKDKRSKHKVDVLLSTAHKAKGLEWKRVKLHDDFSFMRTNVDEWNLIYVAITRAQEELEAPDTLEQGIQNFIKQTYGFAKTDEGKDFYKVIEEG